MENIDQLIIPVAMQGEKEVIWALIKRGADITFGTKKVTPRSSSPVIITS